MPELPEIETLKNGLQKPLIGQRIVSLEINRPSLRYPLSTDLSLAIATKITGLRRRARYLLIDLDNFYSLIIHLGMSGRFTLQNSDYLPQKHDHVIFSLDGQSQLVFNDARRFGMIYIAHTKDPAITLEMFKKFGPEPLSTIFTTKYLKNKLVNRRLPIKNLLLDNQLVVGVGNIYASESLFKACISPLRLSCSLADFELVKLVQSIKDVLRKAILAGGTTLRDFVNGSSQPGLFQQVLSVYGRVGQSCRLCSAVIIKVKQSGRSSFYCPNCQK